MHLLFSAESPSVSWTKGVHISSVQQRSEFLSRERTHSSRSRGFSAAFPVYPLRSEVWSLAFVGGGVGEGLWDTFSSSLSRQSERHRQEAVSELSLIHGASVISQSWASGQSSLRDPECVWKLFLSLDVAVTGSSAAIWFDVPHSVQDCRKHSNRLMCKSVMKFHFFLTLKCKYVISNLRLTVLHLCRMKPSIYLTRLLLFWLFSPSSSLFCL